MAARHVAMEFPVRHLAIHSDRKTHASVFILMLKTSFKLAFSDKLKNKEKLFLPVLKITQKAEISFEESSPGIRELGNKEFKFPSKKTKGNFCFLL